MRFLQTFPTARLLALTLIAVVVTGLAIYWVNASASRKQQDAKPGDAILFDSSAGGCRFEIDGKLAHLRLGEGIRTGDGWRNCDSFDGHTLIVYSGNPPVVAVTAIGDRYGRAPAHGR